MSLRLRVVAAVAFLLLTASLVGTAMAGWQANRVLREELSAALTGGQGAAAGAFAALPRSDDPSRDLDRLVRTFDGNRHLRATLVDRRGVTVGVSTPLAARAAPTWFESLFRSAATDLALAVPAPLGGTFILSPMATNDVAAIWAEFVDLAAVLSASFVIGSALVWFTVGQALRPLSDFSAAFLRIGSGDYSAKVREAGPTELVRLGRGVNEMAGRLAAMQARTHRLEEQLRTLQDEERTDLARDLHDEIGPHLFAVNVDAAMARRLLDEGRGGEAVRQIGLIQDSVGHMQRLVRDILGRLRPTELIELGLKAAVDELVVFWSARQPTIAFSVTLPEDEALNLSESAREVLYRVIQEGLNNSVRHAKPSRIIVEVRKEAHEIVARVADDGVNGGKPEGAGYGLRGMRERLTAAGGSLVVGQDTAGRGWTLTARLPALPRSGEAGDDLDEPASADVEGANPC